MVVTSTTPERQTHESLADRTDLFIDDVHLHFGWIIFGEHLRPNGEESGGNKSLQWRVLFPGSSEQVASDLLLDETGVGFIFVEGINHVVSVTKGVCIGQVFVQAI